MTKDELGLLLFECDVYDALQFVLGAKRAIDAAFFCKNVIDGLHIEVQSSTSKWNAELAEKIIENSKKNEWTGVSDFPDYNITIAGVETSSLFVQNFLISSFFQNCRNAFDILAQSANSGCLASCAKSIESVDFQRMKDVFQQQTYNQAFPDMSDWFRNIAESKEFRYLDAYCNRTKHTCSILTKFTVPIFSDDNKATVPAFYRVKEAMQYEKIDVSEQIPVLYEFLSKAYHDFMIVLKREVQKKTFTNNRFYTVKVYQEKYKQKPEEGYSVAYIDATDDFNRMPETIQGLFAHKLTYPNGKQQVEAGNCIFDTIYVKAKDAVDITGLIGKYVAESPIGEDDLLRFRTYKKVLPKKDTQPLVFEAMNDEKQIGQFYRGNRFFSVETISDDDDLLKLASITL